MKHKFTFACRAAIVLFAAFCCQFPTARAQSYSIDWYKIAGGGGTSTGSVYSISGTVGQPDAGGPMTGGNYSLTGGFWVLAAVQTPGAPTLSITLTGNNAVLYWPTNTVGFVLEHNNSVVASNGWTVVSPAPIAINGFQYVTNSLAPGSHFYRLHNP